MNCADRFGYMIRESCPGFVVWDGWHSAIVRSPSTFTVKDIVGFGTTLEAAEAIVRLMTESVPRPAQAPTKER